MARSTGIILAVGGISYANNFLQDQQFNTKDLKIPVATLGAALLFAGIERLDETVAVGLAWIALVTVLVLPAGKKKQSPLQTLGTLK